MTHHRHRRSRTHRQGALLVAVLAVAAVGCGGAGNDEATLSTAPQTSRPAATTPATVATHPSSGCEANKNQPPAESTTPTEQKMNVDGVERSFLMSTNGTKPDVPAPVIVLLHGMGSSAEDINRVTDLPAKAAKTGSIVITPQAVGTPTLWRPAAQGPDPAFIDQVLGDLAATHCIDTSRVYLTGFSVGAALATAYSCARQDKIAAIVTVTVEAPGGCNKPMPIMSFHGTADPVIAYGNFDPAKGPVAGTEANMANWAATAKCETTPTVTEIGSEVTRLEWPKCADGAEVVLYRITGGGHEWPGKDPATAIKQSTQQVNATDQALEFFGRHSL